MSYLPFSMVAQNISFFLGLMILSDFNELSLIFNGHSMYSRKLYLVVSCFT